MIGIILAVLGFGVLIFIHELGHFVVAKLFGVRVEKFSVGMGRPIVGFRRGETYYQIGWLPFGGFCQFKEDSLPDDLPFTLNSKKYAIVKGNIKDTKLLATIDKWYIKRIPRVLTREFYEAVISMNDDNIDRQTFISCYIELEDESEYLLREEISEKDRFVALEYLESIKPEMVERVLDKNIENNVAARKELSEIIYKNVDLKKLRDKDSFFGVESWKRLLIAFAGPAMNFLLAIILLAVVFMGSTKEVVIPNRITLVDDIVAREMPSPAKVAGLESGDVITSIAGEKIDSFNDISMVMVLQGENKSVDVEILRDKTPISIQLTPEWDKDSMRPIIGVYHYVEPIIQLREGFPLVGDLSLQDGDKIIEIIDENFHYPVINSITVGYYIASNYGKDVVASMRVLRDGEKVDIPLDFKVLSKEISEEQFLLPYFLEVRTTAGVNPFSAIAKGTTESFRMLHMTAIGLYSLVFKPKGDISDQFGGPIKIGYLMKSITESGLSESLWQGIQNFLLILANISLALAFFNLLPFPALDGGYIILSLFEIVTRKSVRMKYIYILNLVGFLILMGLGLLIAFMDVGFIAKQ